MDKFQHKLRMLIVAGSAVGFIGGWGLFAHSGKPVSTDTTTAISIPTELPPLDFSSLESTRRSSGLQNLQSQTPSFSFRTPRLRSGGS